MLWWAPAGRYWPAHTVVRGERNSAGGASDRPLTFQRLLHAVVKHRNGRDKCSTLTVQLKFGGGTIRINVFPDGGRVLPKLDVELFYFFGQINMYVNLAARANLVTLLPLGSSAQPPFLWHGGTF